MLLTAEELTFIDSYLKPADRRWVSIHLQLCEEKNLDRLQVTDEHLGIAAPELKKSNTCILDELILEWTEEIAKRSVAKQTEEIYSAESAKPIRAISYAESVEQTSSKRAKPVKKTKGPEFIRQYCRYAQTSDYQEWFDKYFSRKSIDPAWRKYDYELPPNYVVLEEIPETIPALYGAESLQVIIPEKLHTQVFEVPSSTRYLSPDFRGHNEFFFVKTGVYVGPRKFMPIYADMRINYKSRSTSIA